MDFKDLKRLTVECEGWIRTARLLIQDVMGDDFVFEDASAGVKKGTDRVGSTDSKTTVVEVRIIFILPLIFLECTHVFRSIHHEVFLSGTLAVHCCFSLYYFIFLKDSNRISLSDTLLRKR